MQYTGKSPALLLPNGSNNYVPISQSFDDNGKPIGIKFDSDGNPIDSTFRQIAVAALAISLIAIILFGVALALGIISVVDLSNIATISEQQRGISTDMITFSQLEHTESGEIPFTHNNHNLVGNFAQNMTLPSDLTDGIGKQMTVCSCNGKANTLTLESPATFFQDQTAYSTINIGPHPGLCCITFNIVTSEKISVPDLPDCASPGPQSLTETVVVSASQTCYVFDGPLGVTLEHPADLTDLVGLQYKVCSANGRNNTIDFGTNTINNDSVAASGTTTQIPPYTSVFDFRPFTAIPATVLDAKMFLIDFTGGHGLSIGDEFEIIGYRGLPRDGFPANLGIPDSEINGRHRYIEIGDVIGLPSFFISPNYLIFQITTYAIGGVHPGPQLGFPGLPELFHDGFTIITHPKKKGSSSVIEFEQTNVEPCCVVYDVVSSDEVNVVSRDPCSVFCRNSEKQFCIDPLRPETNPFTGWWIRETTQDSSSFSSLTSGGTPLMFIDGSVIQGETTSSPLALNSDHDMIIDLKCGSRNAVKECDANRDTYGRTGFFQTPGSYPLLWPSILVKQLDEVTLGVTDGVPIVGQNFFGGIPGQETRNISLSFTLQPDGDTLVVFAAANDRRFDPAYNVGVFKRILEADLPPIQKADGSNDDIILPDIDQPKEQFQASVNKLLFEEPTAQESFECENYIGYTAARDLEQIMLTTGTTHTTNIIGVRHTTHYDGARSGPYYSRFGDLTTFICDEYHHLNTASTVTISGFTGDWAIVNGEHIIAGNGGTVFRPGSDGFVDFISGDPANSSYEFNFLVPFGTRNLTDVYTGTPQVVVNHAPITQSIEYLGFVDTFIEWQREVFRTTTTLGVRAWSVSSTSPYTYANTFAEIQAGGMPDVFYSNPGFERTSPPGSAFYVNLGVQFSSFTGFRVNDKYLTYSERFLSSPFNYLITRNNYLQDVEVPYWKPVDLGGTTDRPMQIAASLFYNQGNPVETFEGFSLPYGTFPAVFEGNMINGAANLNCENTDPSGVACVYPSGPGGYAGLSPLDQQFLQERMFYGLVNTDFTGLYKIGHISLPNTLIGDLFHIMNQFDLVPDCQGTSVAGCRETTPRGSIENIVKILHGAIMDKLVNFHEVDAIIIDIRHSVGSTNQPLREFFGATQQAKSYSEVRKHGNGLSPGIDTNDFDLPLDPDMKDIYDQLTSYFVDYTENQYGSTLTHAPVVILSDIQTYAGAEMIPDIFSGENNDRDLGNGVNSIFLGEIDGRMAGCPYIPGFSADVSVKLGPGANRLYIDGVAQPYLQPLPSQQGCMYKDLVSGQYSCNRNDAIKPDCGSTGGLRGKNGVGCAYPNDYESTIYPDMGLEANPHARLPGDTRPQTPTTHFESGPMEWVFGDSFITVTTTAAHGYTTGDDDIIVTGITGDTFSAVGTDVALENDIDKVHTITVTGANTFTFPIFENVDATVTAAGGDRVIISKRSEWRDSPFEDAVKKTVEVLYAKKKRHVKKPKKARVPRATPIKRTAPIVQPCEDIEVGPHHVCINHELKYMRTMHPRDHPYGEIENANDHTSKLLLDWTLSGIGNGNICQDPITGQWQPKLDRMNSTYTVVVEMME